MSIHTSPIILSDAPVDSEGDLIWQNTDIDLDAAMVSDTILNSEDPLVFAIHGPWGSGKTSFLKIVESRLKKQENQTIYVSWYIASNYQSVGDASTTLTLRILRTLRGTKDLDSAEKLYDDLVKPTSSNVKNETMGTYGSLEELASQVALLSDLGILIEDLLDGGGGGDKKKLVLMIDDLDRCSLEYIGDLIEATQRLNSVKNLFIFLAIDQARLHYALEKRFEDVKAERGPRWAGEKYIQHTIELPPLDEKSLDNFIHQSLKSKYSDVENITLEPSAAEALETILESTNYFAVAIRHKFPRTIKACINIIRPALTRKIMKLRKQNIFLDPMEKRKIVKRRLIEYLFRDFSEICLKKAELDRESQEFKFLFKTEELCNVYYSTNVPSPSAYLLFAFQVGRLKVANFLESQELTIPEELAKLLAQPPFFCYEKQQFLFTNATNNAKQKLEEFYYQSQEAKLVGDREACVTAARSAYQFVNDNQIAFGMDVVWMIHNLALNAQFSNDLPLEEALYRLVLQIDPTYVASMVSLSEFIINNRPNLYQEAKLCLEKAKKASDDEWTPFILGNMARVKELLSEDATQELDEIKTRVEVAKDTIEILSYLNAMIRAKHEVEAVQLFTQYAPRFAGTKELASIQFEFTKYLILTGAQSKNIDFIALDLFKQLLDKEELLPRSEIPSLKYYYAYELNRCGYTAQAVVPFFESYNEMRNNPGTTFMIPRFSEFLRNNGGAHLIQKVINREPIERSEWISIKETKSLPTHFCSTALPNYLESR